MGKRPNTADAAEPLVSPPSVSADPRTVFEMLVAMDAQLGAMQRLVRIALKQFTPDPRPESTGAPYQTYDSGD